MDRSLLEHIKLDLGWFPRSMQMVDLLLERNGYVPSVEKISNRVKSQINKPYIQEKGYQIIPLTGTWIGQNCEVRIVRRELFTDYVHAEHVLGEVILEKASVDSQNRLQNFSILYFVDEDRKVSDYDFENTIRHELTHAYEFLQRSLRARDLNQTSPESVKIKLAKLADQDIRSDVLVKLRQEVQRASGFRKVNLKRLCNILYLSLPTEQNAFIAQLKFELSQKASTLSNPRKAAEAVEATSAWRNLEVAKSSLDRIKQLQREENKVDIVKCCAKYFGHVRNFSQAISILEYNLDRFERKLKNRVGKICGELYQNSEEYLRECRRNFASPHEPFLPLTEEDLHEEEDNFTF